MSDNINNIWVLRLINDEGNEIKSLNVVLPKGVTIDCVDVSQKKIEKVTIVSGSKKPAPNVAKTQDVLVREASPPPPAVMPMAHHRPPPIGYHYGHPPPYPGYPHHLNYSQTYLAPVPHHSVQHPIFLGQSPPSPQQQHPLSNVSTSLKEEEIKPEASSSNTKPKKGKVQHKKKAKPSEDVIASQSLKSDLIEEPQSPLPDKDFDRKPPKSNVSGTYAKIAASFTPDPKEVGKEPKQKPPSAPKKPQQESKLSEKYEKGYEPSARKQLRFTKPSLDSIMVKGQISLPDGYDPNHESYPNLGNFNFFAFEIPDRYKESELAELYPQTFKYRLIANAVGVENMKKVQHFWQSKSDEEYDGWHIDFDPVKQFYFTAFYHMRAVYLEDGSYINKCHIFNRFRNDKPSQQCYHGEGCRFYHMCMICGSNKHSAFQRKGKDDRTYVCEEHAKLVAERATFQENEVDDQSFIDEIIFFDKPSSSSSSSSSDDISTTPKVVYADQAVSASPVITAPSTTVFASSSTTPTPVADSEFPPLASGSPARKKKNKKNKSTTTTPTASPKPEIEVK